MLDGIPGVVFTTADNVYNSGTAPECASCYDPSWGRHKARTYPALGNRDYSTPHAAGYFAYFGAAAGDPQQGRYSYHHKRLATGVGNLEQWPEHECDTAPADQRHAEWGDLVPSTSHYIEASCG